MKKIKILSFYHGSDAMSQKTISHYCPFKTESGRDIQAFLDGELHDELDEFPGDLSLLLRERTKLMLKLDTSHKVPQYIFS